MPRRTKKAKKNKSSEVTGDVSAKDMREIERLTKDERNVSPRTAYAMGLLGLTFAEIQAPEMDDFGGTETEKEIRFEFQKQQRQSVLKELALCRQKVIRLRLADQSVAQEEDEQHLQSVLDKEDEKLQKLLERQDRETKRLINDQLMSMQRQREQKEVERRTKEKQRRQMLEVQRQQEIQEEKRKQIMRRRKKAEKEQRQKREQQLREAERLRQENEQRLKEEEQRRKQERERLLQKRKSDMDRKQRENERKNRELDQKLLQKTCELTDRYQRELDKYYGNVQTKSQRARRLREQSFSKQQRKWRQLQREQESHKRGLEEKQRTEEAKLRKFEEEKRARLQREKKQRERKLKEVQKNAAKGEDDRIREINAKQEQAERNRRDFLARKAESDALKRLASSLKKQAALDQILRNKRAKDFRNQVLMGKAQREDERRQKEVQVRTALRQHRLVNDSQAKMHQQSLKEQMLDAEKTGDIHKMHTLLSVVDQSRLSSPARTQRSNGRSQLVSLPPSTVTSLGRMQQLSRLNAKASLSRTQD